MPFNYNKCKFYRGRVLAAMNGSDDDLRAFLRANGIQVINFAVLYCV